MPPTLQCLFPSAAEYLHPAATAAAAAAAAAAKSLQLCPTLCDPIDGSPPGSAIPGILQARTLEWGAISFSNAWTWKVKVKSLSHVWLFATSWTAAHQAPLSMGFSRQEYWSGVPLPSPFSIQVLSKKWSFPETRISHAYPQTLNLLLPVQLSPLISHLTAVFPENFSWGLLRSFFHSPNLHIIHVQASAQF